LPGPLPIADLDLILEHTRELWPELRGERIFITGGTGFFGSWLVESFLHANRELSLNAQATILTRNPAGFNTKSPHLSGNPALTLQAGDISSFDFPIGRFSHIIHAATDTVSGSSAESQRQLFASIVDGTEWVLQFAEAADTSKFLLTSSGAVYGRQPAKLTHVPESYPGAPDSFDPASAYGEGKRAAELMCALHQKAAAHQGRSFEAKIARCWAFCGPHLPLDAHFAIGNFIGDVIAGRPISIGGDGTPRRSYLYAADLAIWLWTILFRGPSLVPINVGSAHDVSIRELAEAVVETLAPHIAVHVAKHAVQGAAPSRYVPSVARAAKLLGLRPSVSLEEAIQRTFAWATSQG
jgi:nucleoside-diphosphate-sugar epimerase